MVLMIWEYFEKILDDDNVDDYDDCCGRCNHGGFCMLQWFWLFPFSLMWRWWFERQNDGDDDDDRFAFSDDYDDLRDIMMMMMIVLLIVMMMKMMMIWET